MQRVITLIAFSALIIILTGCAATTKQFRPYPNERDTVDNPTEGRIYILREKGGRASGQGTNVIVDGEVIGVLGPASYISFEHAPGTVKVTLKQSAFKITPKLSKSVDIDVEAGKQYYIHSKLQSIPFVGLKPWAKLVTNEFGKNMLKDLNPGTVEKQK